MRITTILTVGLGISCLSTVAVANTDLGVNGIFSNSSYGGSGATVGRRERYIDEDIGERHRTRMAAYVPDEEETIEAPKPVEVIKPPLPVRKDKAASKPRMPQLGINGAIVSKKAPEPLIPKEFADDRRALKCLTKDTREVFLKAEAQFGRMEIVSTCVVKNIRGTGMPSQHSFGRAIDFNAPKGRKKEVVQWFIKNKKAIGANGVMTYSNFDHIHVDTGRYKFVSLGHAG